MKSVAKPSFPERHSAFISILELEKLIITLETAYIETNNEKVYYALEKLKDIRNTIRSNEAVFQEKDWQEAFAMIGELPHAVAVFLNDAKLQ